MLSSSVPALGFILYLNIRTHSCSILSLFLSPFPLILLVSLLTLFFLFFLAILLTFRFFFLSLSLSLFLLQSLFSFHHLLLKSTRLFLSLSLRCPFIPSFLVSPSVSFLPLFRSSAGDSKILPPCCSRSCCTVMARLTRMFQKLICLQAALRLHRRMGYHLLFAQILLLKHGVMSFRFFSERIKFIVGNNELT